MPQGGVTPIASVLPSATTVKIEVKSQAYRKPTNQWTSSVGEGCLDQQPMRYANTTIDTNIVNKNLRFSLRERVTCKIFICRKLFYSQISVENLSVKGQASFSVIVKGQASFSV